MLTNFSLGTYLMIMMVKLPFEVLRERIKHLFKVKAVPLQYCLEIILSDQELNIC